MAVQTTYQINHEAAYAGMVADLQVCNTISKLNKSDTVNIPYGYGVVTDGDNGATTPNSVSTAAEFIGIAMRELDRAYQDDEVFGAQARRPFTVVTHGVVWVNAEVAVAKDDPVFLIVSDGTGTDQGKWSNVVGAGATLAVEIPGAKWVSSAVSGALAKISLGLGG